MPVRFDADGADALDVDLGSSHYSDLRVAGPGKTEEREISGVRESAVLTDHFHDLYKHIDPP
jgi:hypothetical protein